MKYSWEGYYVFKKVNKLGKDVDEVLCLTEDPKDSKSICDAMNSQDGEK